MSADYREYWSAQENAADAKRIIRITLERMSGMSRSRIGSVLDAVCVELDREYRARRDTQDTKGTKSKRHAR